MKSYVITDIPNTPEGIAAAALHAAKGVQLRKRGRGRRVHGGAKYFNSLPLGLAGRFTLYVDAEGSPSHERTFFACVGINLDNSKMRLEVK